MKTRETWKSSIGFTLAAAGSAVGLANIWKFSYVVGEHGGAAFLAVYFLCLLLIGVPVLFAELSVGRKSSCSAVLAYTALSTRWGRYIGGWTFLTALIVSGFYASVAGWVLGYAVDAAQALWVGKRSFVNLSNLTDSPSLSIFFHGFFVLICSWVVCLGVQKGVEKVSLFGMPFLLILLFFTMIWSLLQPGALAGVVYVLNPDWSALSPQAFLTALGHAFFTLSLGQGTMMTYGSYLPSDVSMKKSLLRIVSLDTLISVMAAVMIFACAGAVGIQPDAGPSLLFETLPRAFDILPFGSVFNLFFFVLVALAAITSEISVMEIIASYFTEHYHYSRKKAGLLTGSLSFLVGLPAALSANMLSHIQFFSKGILEFMDWAATSIFIPMGGLFAVMAFMGLEKNMSYLKRVFFGFIAPAGILIIFVCGLFTS
ncbi:MAG: sodium-dependent transporter [Oligoflexales bacterium]